MAELGINLVHIISYIIIFFVLYLFSRRFLNKLFRNLEERRTLIQQGIDNAARASVLKEEKIKEAEAEREKIIEKAFRESEEILSKAKAKADDIIEKGIRERESLLMYAKQEIDELKERSKNEGLKEARAIISAALKKAFDKIVLSEDQEKEFIEISLENLKK